MYSIRSPLELERIFLYLCNVSSNIVSFSAIARELDGISRATVENYVKYLGSANLIFQSWPVDMGGRKRPLSLPVGIAKTEPAPP